MKFKLQKQLTPSNLTSDTEKLDFITAPPAQLLRKNYSFKSELSPIQNTKNINKINDGSHQKSKFTLPSLSSAANLKSIYWKNQNINSTIDLSAKIDLKKELQKKENYMKLLEEVEASKIIRDPFEESDKNEIEKLDGRVIEKQQLLTNVPSILKDNKNVQSQKEPLESYTNKNSINLGPMLNIDMINTVMIPEEAGPVQTNQLNSELPVRISNSTTTEYIRNFKKYMQDMHGGNAFGEKSLENMKYDLNKFTFNELIGKKIKDELAGISTDMAPAEIRSAAKHSAKNLVGKFQTLNNQFGYNYSDDICYDYLSTILKEKNTRKEAMFSFSEEYEKLLKKINSPGGKDGNLAGTEALLLESFEEVKKIILHKRHELKELFKLNNKTIITMQKHKEYFLKEISKCEDEENGFALTNKKDMYQKLSRRGGIQERFKLNDYMKLNEIKVQIDNLKSKMKDAMEKGNIKIKNIRTETDKMDNEIKILNFKKRFLKLKLKDIYLRILEDEEETIKFPKNIYQIIQLLWSFNFKVLPLHFSKLYDKETIEYILNYAELDFKVKKLFNNEEANSKQNPQNGVPNFSAQIVPHSFCDIINNENSVQKDLQNKLKDVQNRIFDIKKSLLKREKRVSIKYFSSVPESPKFATLDDRLDRDAPGRLAIFNKEIHSMLLKPKDNNTQMNSGLIEMTEKMQKLRENEIARILKTYNSTQWDAASMNNLSKILQIIANEYTSKMEVQKITKEKGLKLTKI